MPFRRVTPVTRERDRILSELNWLHRIASEQQLSADCDTCFAAASARIDQIETDIDIVLGARS